MSDIPTEIQDLIDNIVLEEDQDGEPDPDWLVALWPLVLAKLSKGIKDSNWKLWTKAWKDVVEAGFESGLAGDVIGTTAPGLFGSSGLRPSIQYFMDHGMELVKTLSQTDVQVLKGQMLDNWGKGEDAFKAAFEDQYSGPARLDKIYRTEYAKAANEGIVVRAKAAGHLFKMWRCPNDERSCPECSAMDYEVVGIDEMFSGGVMTPGLHPFCRCVLISVEDQDSEVLTEDVEPIIV
jgi:SPP1 gp7 family putative phage head morphogenesis protein